MNFWHDLPRPIIGLSPMDGVTDASFRYITAQHGGPDVTLTEFVNVQAAVYSPHTLLQDLTYCELERPVVAQVYGKAPELFYKVARLVCELGFDGLDINMGCPAKKVAASGCGAALIRTPDLAREIIRAAQQGIKEGGGNLGDLGLSSAALGRIGAANGQRKTASEQRPRRFVPVSIKTRLGYDRDVIEGWLNTLLEEKPAAVSIHGRTLEQGYKGDADWHAISRAVKVAEGSGVLILGNGDVQDLRDAYQRVCQTGVDGVLIGRGAQGNPWLFRQKETVKRAFRENAALRLEAVPVSVEERFRVIVEHCEHFERLSGAARFVAMRKHLTWYCRGFRGAAEMRARMTRANGAGDVRRYVAEFMSRPQDEVRSARVSMPVDDFRATEPLLPI